MNAREERQKLYSLLGDLPERDLPLKTRTIYLEEKGGYTLEHLILDPAAGTERNPDGQPIPALFAKPHGKGPFPAILFSHSHGGFYDVGKNELLCPAPYMYPVPYAQELTRMGFAVLAIDSWCFGERSGRSETSVFKELLWKGQTLWGRMVYDSLRALDYLCERSDIIPEKIGALGMSMGSTMTWWLAALDERIAYSVDICCLTDYDSLIEDNGLDGHGFYYFVPGLLKHFKTSDIVKLIAPRPHLSTVGLYDALTPAKGVDKVEKEVSAYYASLGCPDGFKILRYPVAHKETCEMRQNIVDFLQKQG